MVLRLAPALLKFMKFNYLPLKKHQSIFSDRLKNQLFYSQKILLIFQIPQKYIYENFQYVYFLLYFFSRSLLIIYFDFSLLIRCILILFFSLKYALCSIINVKLTANFVIYSIQNIFVKFSSNALGIIISLFHNFSIFSQINTNYQNCFSKNFLNPNNNFFASFCSVTNSGS